MIECWLMPFLKFGMKYRTEIDALEFDSVAHQNELLAIPKKFWQQFFVCIWEHRWGILRDQVLKEHLFNHRAARPTLLHATRNMT